MLLSNAASRRPIGVVASEKSEARSGSVAAISGGAENAGLESEGPKRRGGKWTTGAYPKEIFRTVQLASVSLSPNAQLSKTVRFIYIVPQLPHMPPQQLCRRRQGRCTAYAAAQALGDGLGL